MQNKKGYVNISNQIYTLTDCQQNKSFGWQQEQVWPYFCVFTQPQLKQAHQYYASLDLDIICSSNKWQ